MSDGDEDKWVWDDDDYPVEVTDQAPTVEEYVIPDTRPALEAALAHTGVQDIGTALTLAAPQPRPAVTVLSERAARVRAALSAPDAVVSDHRVMVLSAVSLRLAGVAVSRQCLVCQARSAITPPAPRRATPAPRVWVNVGLGILVVMLLGGIGVLLGKLHQVEMVLAQERSARVLADPLFAGAEAPRPVAERATEMVAVPHVESQPAEVNRSPAPPSGDGRHHHHHHHDAP